MPAWLAAASTLQRICQAEAGRWTTVAGSTPSLQILTDKTAEAFASIGHAVEGIALLMGSAAPPVPRGARKSLRVPDWQSPLVSPARTFSALGAVMVVWIVIRCHGGSLA